MIKITLYIIAGFFIGYMLRYIVDWNGWHNENKETDDDKI